MHRRSALLLLPPGHGVSKRESREVYSRVTLTDAQHTYGVVINQYPV